MQCDVALLVHTWVWSTSAPSTRGFRTLRSYVAVAENYIQGHQKKTYYSKVQRNFNLSIVTTTLSNDLVATTFLVCKGIRDRWQCSLLRLLSVSKLVFYLSLTYLAYLPSYCAAHTHNCHVRPLKQHRRDHAYSIPGAFWAVSWPFWYDQVWGLSSNSKVDIQCKFLVRKGMAHVVL